MTDTYAQFPDKRVRLLVVASSTSPILTCLDTGSSMRASTCISPSNVFGERDQPEPPFPGFGQFCIDVHDLPRIYPSWQERPREVKGIYVLVDKKTGQQYVGSAKGEESVGRFCDYARTGRRGNVEVKHRTGAQYQIGVLQIVDMSLPDHTIEETEGW
jgi:hypothetical protein